MNNFEQNNEKDTANNISDVVYVTVPHIFCDGSDCDIGHPKIYIAIDSDTCHASCPYCSKNFLLLVDQNDTPKI